MVWIYLITHVAWIKIDTPARPLRSSLDPNILKISAARTKSCGHIVQCYFHVSVSFSGSFVIIVYFSLINTYYVLWTFCFLTSLDRSCDVFRCLLNVSFSSTVLMPPGTLFQLMGPWYANARFPYDFVLAAAMLRIFWIQWWAQWSCWSIHIQKLWQIFWICSSQRSVA